jgi:hypothetical protein
MRTTVAVLLCAPFVASAQFKCVDERGAVSFQQVPCAAQQRQQALKIAPPAPAPKAQEGGSADQRILRGLERERHVRELEFQVSEAERTIDNRSASMNAELASLQHQKARAKNNLAGATYEQSVSAEMQAVVARHKVMIDMDTERLKKLRADLAAAKQAR